MSAMEENVCNVAMNSMFSNVVYLSVSNGWTFSISSYLNASHTTLLQILISQCFFNFNFVCVLCKAKDYKRDLRNKMATRNDATNFITCGMTYRFYFDTPPPPPIIIINLNAAYVITWHSFSWRAVSLCSGNPKPHKVMKWAPFWLKCASLCGNSALLLATHWAEPQWRSLVLQFTVTLPGRNLGGGRDITTNTFFLTSEVKLNWCVCQDCSEDVTERLISTGMLLKSVSWRWKMGILTVSVIFFFKQARKTVEKCSSSAAALDWKAFKFVRDIKQYNAVEPSPALMDQFYS